MGVSENLAVCMDPTTCRDVSCEYPQQGPLISPLILRAPSCSHTKADLTLLQILQTPYTSSLEVFFKAQLLKSPINSCLAQAGRPRCGGIDQRGARFRGSFPRVRVQGLSSNPRHL